MTSSGISTFNPTLSEIIAQAYRECGIIARVETPDPDQLINGRFKLNLMLKEWMKTPGYHVWSTEQGILFLQKSQRRYQLGSTGADHATDAFDFASTTLTAAAASGATALTVSSITDIAASDYLGIELDSDEFQWTTVNGAPSGTTVTAAVALTGAAASGNRVIAYTTKLIRPLAVLNTRWFHYTDLTEQVVTTISNAEYQELPNKTTESEPIIQAWYQPKIPLGIMSVWNTPSAVTYAAKFSYNRPIYDFTANSETADVPIEWGNALIFGLAAELIPSGNVPLERAEIILKMATAKLATAMAGDREPESIYYQPDMDPGAHRITYGQGR